MTDLELIKQKINIVDLIQEYLPLKKTGINFKANCPFHQEKTPSFVVSPERGIWHCFGCSKGGDIFKFIMEKENLSFPESIEILAQKAGVTLSDKKPAKNKNDRFYEIHTKTAQFYHYLLLDHPLGGKALKYLKKRGLTAETIKEFNLGYAPQNWEVLTNFLKKRGFTTSEIIDSGLGVPSKSGCYDRFRGRIVFPLTDTRGRVIALSGRVLDSGEPKYINTPQTPIFDKSQFLFGIHLSKAHIRDKKEAIIVEGEMDMLLSFQVGVKNIVASKGTALTEGQINLLKKYTDTLSLCFDTDFAGDNASKRGIEIADRTGLNLKVVRIKEGKDPADLCVKNPQNWKESVIAATPVYDYYLESVSARFDIKSATGKREVGRELFPIWEKISDPMVKEHYIQKLSALLQVKDEFLRKELSRSKSAPQSVYLHNLKASPSQKDNQPSPRDRRKLLEEYLISLILHLPPSHNFVPSFPETLFTEESLRQLYVLLVIYLDNISFKGKSFKISEFVKMITEEEAISTIDRLYLREIDSKLEDPVFWQKEMDLVIRELKKMLIKASLEKLSLEIKNAQSFEKIEVLGVLNKKFRDLSLKLKNL